MRALPPQVARPKDVREPMQVARPSERVRRMPRTIVFDVNETLLDIGALEPHFVRTFGDRLSLREWFDTLLLVRARLLGRRRPAFQACPRALSFCGEGALSRNRPRPSRRGRTDPRSRLITNPEDGITDVTCDPLQIPDGAASRCVLDFALPPPTLTGDPRLPHTTPMLDFPSRRAR